MVLVASKADFTPWTLTVVVSETGTVRPVMALYALLTSALDRMV
jgi:hypothetical protein